MRLQERLLEDILSARRVTHESGKKPHQIRLMPLDQDLNRPGIAAAVQFKQSFISALGHKINTGRKSLNIILSRRGRMPLESVECE